MMSELNSPSTPLASVARPNRRNSVLPSLLSLPHAPTPQQLQMLELENVALSEELAHSEERVRLLQSQLSSQPSSSSSAEVKAAKRLLHRLTTHISSFSPLTNGEVDEGEELFSLDQSLIHDPERSILNPSSLSLSTPNGKHRVERGFEGDLLDDIEGLRGVWEDWAKGARFREVEMKVRAEGAERRNEQLTSELQGLQAQAQELEQERTLITQLQSELEEKKAEVEQAHAETAEQEALIQELRGQVESAQSQKGAELGERDGQIKRLQEELSSLQTQYQASSATLLEKEELIAQLQAQLSTAAEEKDELQARLEAESRAHTKDLETDADSRATAASSEVRSILSELQAKKERLHAIQLHQSQIFSLQRVVEQQERFVSLLDRTSHGSDQIRRSWVEHSEQLSTSLASLRTTTSTDAKKQDEELVESLRSEIQELQGRVLRRNEQIGSLQRDLQATKNNLDRTRTNQALAEETVEELEEERDQLLGRVEELESRLASASSEEPREEVGVQAETHRDVERELETARGTITQLESRISSLPTPSTEHMAVQAEGVVEEVQELKEQLQTAHERVQSLEAQLREEKAALEATIDRHLAKITHLEEEIASIPTPASKEDAGMQTTESIERVEELERSLTATQDQVHSLQAQVDSLTSDKDALQAELESEIDTHLEQIRELEEKLAALPTPASLEDTAVQTDESAQQMRELQSELTAAQDQVHSLQSQVESLTSDRTALQTAKEDLESQVASLNKQLSSLDSTLSATEERAAATAAELDSELDLLRNQLSTSQTRLTTTLLEVDSLQLSLAEQRELNANLQNEHDLLVTSSERTQSELTETKAGLTELLGKIAEVEAARAAADSELAELQAKHAELERVLTERTEALEGRNGEYWELKEELAELQEAAERSRGESELQERLAAQESALMRLKADVAAARSTEEMLMGQYSASQRRVQELEKLISEPRQSDEDKVRLEELQAEVEDLHMRIGEMEEELGRKAEEIEEADSKILEALKESKKYATRYNKLSARYEGLQKEAEAAKGREEGAKEELERLRKRLEQPKSASKETNLAGRKRAKPDTLDEEEGGSATPSRGEEVRAVYAPSTRTPAAAGGSSSFTPKRRTAPLKSSSSRTPHRTPIVLGLGTPTTSQETEMTRSTSNPSELIAARILNSPAKAQMLGDKTNLGPAPVGTSRLSSKVLGTKEVKPVTSLLPKEKEEERRERKKAPLPSSAAPVAGGGGAADFLARMKAQRSASART